MHGSCAGGGLALSLCCDIRVAGESSKFVASFINIGLSGCELGTSFYLQRLVGLTHASELLLTGDTIDAQRAERINLVNAVVEDKEVMNRSLAIAKKMVNASPLGLKLTKRQVRNASEVMSLHAALHSEDVGQVLCLNDKETMDLMRAKTEKFVAKFSKSKL